MFHNAFMLIGIGAAVVPLVLHLLSRARYRDVDWGAMMFLDSADGQRHQSARFTQWLLLLMRSAIIALLAFALARPVAQGKWSSADPQGRVTAALLLDCSASMGFDENGRTRFQMAQAAARQIIRGLRPGDRVALILMGVPYTTAEIEPTGDLRAIEARIDEAKISYGRADLAESLGIAADTLGRFEKSARDVYVVCDRQALSWDSFFLKTGAVNTDLAAKWRSQMTGPGVITRTFVLPIGSVDADNIAVDSARLVNSPAIVGQPADVEVMVHNYGPVSHAAVPVSIEGSNLAVEQKSISLAPGQSVSIVFPVTFAQSGSQVLIAKIKSAGYTSDDQLDMAVDVIPPIRVLVVSGDEQQGQFRGAGDFLKWALAPHRAAGMTGGDPCDVTVVAAEKWSDADLPKYQVVVLANVERFTRDQASALEKYVYNGGQLLIAPGSLSRVDNYNERLYRDGAGILPAMLEPPTSADGSDATTLLGFHHSIFSFMHGQYEVSATIARYFPVVRQHVDAKQLAEYLTNDPFLIEYKSEGGRVLLMTTPLDADWSTLPLSNFYLPFVQSAVRYLASRVDADRDLAPGSSIRQTFDDAAPDRKVTLTRPDGKLVRLDVIKLEKQAKVRYSDTDEPGQYRLEINEPGKAAQTFYYIVRPPIEESNLTQLTPERWSELEKSLGFTRVDPSQRPIAETMADNRQGIELWEWALSAVLALVGLEMLIARVATVQRRTNDRADDFAVGERSDASSTELVAKK